MSAPRFYGLQELELQRAKVTIVFRRDRAADVVGEIERVDHVFDVIESALPNGGRVQFPTAGAVGLRVRVHVGDEQYRSLWINLDAVEQIRPFDVVEEADDGE